MNGRCAIDPREITTARQLARPLILFYSNGCQWPQDFEVVAQDAINWAIVKFNPAREAKFTTFVRRVVDNALKRERERQFSKARHEIEGDQPVNGGSGDPYGMHDTLFDRLPDDSTTLEERQLRANFLLAVAEEARNLPRRHRELIERHYYHGETLTNIGISWGITSSAMSQQHERIIKTLRSRLENWI